jgi:SAM-dependent methyltransferase
MNWKIKGVVQKVLSSVPGGVWMNDVLQRTAGELRHFEDVVDSKVVDDWLVLARHTRKLNRPAQGLVFTEVGTGWFPTLPLCYYLAGARECYTFDLNRHLNAAETVRMARRLKNHLPAIAEACVRPLADVEASYAALQPALDSGDAMDLLRRAGIVYRAPGDASATGLPDASVDVAFSNSVLEHVPRNVIQAMFHEQRRILKPGGLAVHSVNCGDHYAYFDRALNPVAYLTYSERDWSFWNNDLLYQNRLRPRDFLEMASAAGLELPLVEFRAKQALLDKLPSLKIDPAFAAYPPEQLCCTSIDFVAQRSTD